MDLATFGANMVCGMGRCYVTLRDAPDKESYFKAVAWGLTHSIAYNAKSEDSRGEYMYSLASLFDQPQRFLPNLVDVFLSDNAADEDFTRQLCDELQCFARAGYTEATRALMAKLNFHMNDLVNNDGDNYDSDEFNCIAKRLFSCIELSEAVQIAERIGDLFLHQDYFDDDDCGILSGYL